MRYEPVMKNGLVSLPAPAFFLPMLLRVVQALGLPTFLLFQVLTI